MTHACYNPIVIGYNISKGFNIFHFNNRSHPFCDISCKFHLMVINVFIELMLPWHNNRCFSNLKRHNKTCWATVGDYNARICYILNHLLVRNQLAPLAIFWFVCTETRLNNDIFGYNAIFF